MNVPFLNLDVESDSSSAEDRRAGERKLCRVSALFRAIGQSTIHAKTLDVSIAGVALLLPTAFPRRTAADVSFQLYVNDSIRQITAKVEVMNSVFLSSDVRVGCRFLFVDENSRKTLEEFLR